MLEKLYYQTKSLIDSVDFSDLWRGFHPMKFALYDETRCFFDGGYVEKTEQFLANTSIFYQGEYIAIWNVTRKEKFRGYSARAYKTAVWKVEP